MSGEPHLPGSIRGIDMLSYQRTMLQRAPRGTSEHTAVYADQHDSGSRRFGVQTVATEHLKALLSPNQR